MDRKTEALNYLKQYPKMTKWMNTCICCGTMGYNPDMPEKRLLREMAMENITLYFQET